MKGLMQATSKKKPINQHIYIMEKSCEEMRFNQELCQNMKFCHISDMKHTTKQLSYYKHSQNFPERFCLVGDRILQTTFFSRQTVVQSRSRLYNFGDSFDKTGNLNMLVLGSKITEFNLPLGRIVKCKLRSNFTYRIEIEPWTLE